MEVNLSGGKNKEGEWWDQIRQAEVTKEKM